MVREVTSRGTAKKVERGPEAEVAAAHPDPGPDLDLPLNQVNIQVEVRMTLEENIIGEEVEIRGEEAAVAVAAARDHPGVTVKADIESTRARSQKE